MRKSPKKKNRQKTPLRRALVHDSDFLPFVMNGLGALTGGDPEYIDTSIRKQFADSLDLDEATKKGHEEENRWDYLLGLSQSGKIVAIEPHSAKEKEVARVVKKRSAALQHLRGHLRDGQRIAKWLWVSSGDVHFADTEKVRRQLDQNGIEFVGKLVQARHLP